MIRHRHAGEQGVVELNNSSQLVAYAPVRGTDWVLLKHAPTSNAYALRTAVGNDLLLLFGVALFGFILLGATIGRNTVKSLNVLRDNAESIAEGDLAVSVPDTDRVDEVGQALSAFDETVTYLDTVAAQADALASQEFDAAVLDEAVPGDLGRSLATMRTDLEEFVSELERTRSDAREAREEAETLAASLESQAERMRELGRDVSVLDPPAGGTAWGGYAHAQYKFGDEEDLQFQPSVGYDIIVAERDQQRASVGLNTFWWGTGFETVLDYRLLFDTTSDEQVHSVFLNLRGKL